MAENKEAVGYGLGRRKTAIARVWLTKGAGDRTVNGQEWMEYFPTIPMQATAMLPLVLTSTNEEYSVTAKVEGGGKQAQVDAVSLALARALLGIDPNWRKQLKEAGLLTRDPRAKERKKYGLKRARRAPQFSKR